MNVAGSASWTHKHDGDNTFKFFNIILWMLVRGQTGGIVVKSKRIFWRVTNKTYFLQERYK